jgi:hypothetical protein
MCMKRRVSISHPFFGFAKHETKRSKNCFAKFRLFRETIKTAKFRFVLFCFVKSKISFRFVIFSGFIS